MEAQGTGEEEQRLLEGLEGSGVCRLQGCACDGNLARALLRELRGAGSQPPFEFPNIVLAVARLVEHRFRGADESQRQLMRDSARIFLRTVDAITFGPEEAACARSYARWLIHCRPGTGGGVWPASLAFGRSWLRLVLPDLRRRLSAQRQGPVLFLNSFFVFLTSLEIELQQDDSPVWRDDRLQLQRPFAEEASDRSGTLLLLLLFLGFILYVAFFIYYEFYAQSKARTGTNFQEILVNEEFMPRYTMTIAE